MKKYRGRDRRILLKLEQLFNLVEDRDTLALGTRKTAKISHRDLFFPIDDNALMAAVHVVRDRIDELIDATI